MVAAENDTPNDDNITPSLPIFSQGFDISDLLSFDSATMGLTTLGAKVPTPEQSANLPDQLKGLLSAPISTLVDDSREIQKILEQIESQLPESLRVKLWPAGHLPFFRAEVKAAQQRIELRHSQIPLKADIA